MEIHYFVQDNSSMRHGKWSCGQWVFASWSREMALLFPRYMINGRSRVIALKDRIVRIQIQSHVSISAGSFLSNSNAPCVTTLRVRRSSIILYSIRILVGHDGRRLLRKRTIDCRKIRQLERDWISEINQRKTNSRRTQMRLNRKYKKKQCSWRSLWIK